MICYVSNTVPPPRAPAPPDEFLLEAMREVDAMLPHTPPIAPPESAVLLRLVVKGMDPDEVRRLDSHGNPSPARLDLSRLMPPDAGRAGVSPGRVPAPPPPPPKCDGPGGCGEHHRKGITCGQALLERARQNLPRPVPGPGRSRFG